MPELTLATALVAGLLGSAHCVAMCGGIAAALGATGDARLRFAHPLLYQLGRISSYGVAGAIAGSAGAATGRVLDVAAWGDVLRVATALVVVAIGLDIALGGGARARWLRAPERLGGAVWRRVAPAAQVALPTRPAARALALGMLWGWLPCGLVYSVLLAAAVSGGAVAGGLTMLAFGAGTLPALLGLAHVGAWLRRGDGALARVAGALIVACGLWTASLPLANLLGTEAHQHHVTTVDPAR